jgi:hypothetical protein
LIPGLPQLWLRQTDRAKKFLGAWLILLLGAGWFFGHLFGAFLLGLALSCHALSILLPYQYALATMHWGRRSICSLLVYAALLLMVYVPLRKTTGRFVLPVAVGEDIAQIIAKGDTVLVRRSRNPLWMPNYSSLVMIDRSFQGQLMNPPGFPWAFYAHYSNIFDRVLGHPGDRLAVRGGKLFRNGLLVPDHDGPLRSDALPEGMDITVPEGNIFVWPSLAIQQPKAVNSLHYGAISPTLLGTPWRIAAPFSRRKFLGS